MGRSALLASMGVFLSGLACEALQMQMPADGGVDPSRPGSGNGAPPSGGSPSIPSGGSTGPGAGGPPSIPGAITPAEATPDCPAPIKAPAIGGAVIGRVCSRNAARQCQPITGALVAYHVKELAPICLRGRATTGSDGRFRIAGIEPASYGHYSFVFMAAGHLQRGEALASISEGREEDFDDVDLPIAAEATPASSLHRATIAGHVCGRDGVRNCIPLAGASVGYRPGADAAPKIIAEVKADKDGRFALPAVEPATFGRYRISVVAKGYDQRSEAVPGAYPGSTAWLDDVDVVGAADGVESRDLLTATIAGTVCTRNTSGCAPLPGAEVALLDGQDQTQVLRSTRTDGKGRFGFSGLTPESRTFTVRYQAPDGSAMDTTNVYGLDVGDTKHVECELRGR